MSSVASSFDPPTFGSKQELSDLELEILRATTTNSLSTVAIAEQVGHGCNPTTILPVLDRLEQLELLNGYFAAGRVMTSASEVHRKYYRISERGQQIVC
jgi:DNA-binding PadR family transcriptional regulator